MSEHAPAPAPRSESGSGIGNTAGGPATVAIVGGGPAGFAAARELLAGGTAVTLFDRGRTPGGRCSTRRSRSGVSFDHGAPYFTVGTEAFAAAVEAWAAAGVVAPWPGRFLCADPGGREGRGGRGGRGGRRDRRDQRVTGGDPAALESPRVRWRPDPRKRYVGVPRMSALVEHLAAEAGAAEVRLETEVVALRGQPRERGAGGPWVLRDAEDAEHGPFDAVLLAVAAPQAERLVAEVSPRLARLAARAKPAGCFAAMLAFEEPLGLAPVAADLGDGEEPAAVDAVRLDRGPLSWIGRETNKPGRDCRASGDSGGSVGSGGGAECWVLHARPTWSAPRLDGPPEGVIEPLKAAFQQLAGVPLPPTVYEAAHRWKFAYCVKPLPDGCFVSAKHGLAACGDWFGGPRGVGGIEAAIQSGHAAASGLRGGPVSPAASEPSKQER